MSDEAYVEKLESTLAQILKPLKGVPFSVVVRSLANQNILRMDIESAEDCALLETLKKVIEICAAELKNNPIERSRPNEVGNDVEEYVKNALRAVGYRVEQPRSKSGKAKAAGYPDILFYDVSDRPTYLECKIFSDDTQETTMRSFYLSPSEDFKVSMDARHLLLSFKMVRTPIAGSNLSSFQPAGFKLVDLFALDCDMKHEFNADNRRLYDAELVLKSGPC